MLKASYFFFYSFHFIFLSFFFLQKIFQIKEHSTNTGGDGGLIRPINIFN